MPAKSKTSNSLNPYSSKKIEVLRTETMQIKYPNLEKTNCMSYMTHIDNVSLIYAGFSTPFISIERRPNDLLLRLSF
jgi:hypothetical protein